MSVEIKYSNTFHPPMSTLDIDSQSIFPFKIGTAQVLDSPTSITTPVYLPYEIKESIYELTIASSGTSNFSKANSASFQR